MEYITNVFSNLNWFDITAVSSPSFLLIFAAEMGDKSQLVCMVLAARYRALPVMLGATLAFLVLNTLAVLFGASIANMVPEVFIYSIVAILFAVFGVHALRIEEDKNDENGAIRTNGSIFVGTFLLIVVAEFGDKTQLAVIALSSASLPIAVWLGSSFALITTSALGVWAGRTILQKIPIIALHRISGIIFISLALFAAYKTYVVI